MNVHFLSGTSQLVLVSVALVFGYRLRNELRGLCCASDQDVEDGTFTAPSF